MGQGPAAQVAPRPVALGLRLAAWTALHGPHDTDALADLRQVAHVVRHLDPLTGRQAALQALQAVDAAAAGQCSPDELQAAVAPAVAAFDRLLDRTPWARLQAVMREALRQ